MAAYIDEFKCRFGVGPICRILAESLDCGFLAPRGYRMFKTRPVSRMRACHEAPARDILAIHSDFLTAVYGFQKVHAQLLAQGWDPAEVGRDQVMSVMCELGIKGVRRGGTPVTTKPAKGTGGEPDRRARSATRTTTSWPSPPTARTRPNWSGGANPSMI